MQSQNEKLSHFNSAWVIILILILTANNTDVVLLILKVKIRSWMLDGKRCTEFALMVNYALWLYIKLAAAPVIRLMNELRHFSSFTVKVCFKPSCPSISTEDFLVTKLWGNINQRHFPAIRTFCLVRIQTEMELYKVKSL